MIYNHVLKSQLQACWMNNMHSAVFSSYINAYYELRKYYDDGLDSTQKIVYRIMDELW